MALSSSTFSAAGGAVDSLFAGLGDLAGGKLKAKGLNLQAEGTRISAQSTRLNAEGLRIKARGDLAEASEYDLAGGLATQNIAFTEQSQAIKQMQTDRQITNALGETRAGVAGAGFASSGSALDILRDSASQGALTKAVLGQQGLITEAGYKEQADSYKVMSDAARMAASSEFGIADQTDVLANRTDRIADQTDQLAKDTLAASETAATGHFLSGAIKGVAALASVGLAPFTGGASLAVGAAAAGAMSGTGGLY